MDAETHPQNLSKSFRWSLFGGALAIPLGLAGFLLLRPAERIEVTPPTVPATVIRLIQDTVEPHVARAAARTAEKDSDPVRAAMRSFYEGRQFRPAWLTAEGPKPQAWELMNAIDAAAAEGLDPRAYPKDRLNAALGAIRVQPGLDDPIAQRRFAGTELSLTYTYLALAAHLANGQLRPDALDIDWHDKRPAADPSGALRDAVREGGSVQESLRDLAPASPDSVRLREALARYERIAVQGGWPAVGTTLRRGARGAAVRRLRTRLAAEGDLPPIPADAGDLYDDAVAAGVSRFQRRHGLDENGKVDAATLAELDKPVQERIRQIAVNLERRRWLPSDFGPRYIAVNIPDYRMKLVDDGQTALEMRAVVGKTPGHETPEISSTMTCLVLNPAWNIPDGIVDHEIKPALAKDPGYLERKHIEVVKSGAHERWRALPGPTNPLGQVKFLFPNPFDVYLHDTTADSLFAANRRAFSHGCVRLEKPVDLANALLSEDSRWTPDAVQTAIDSGETHTVSLPHPMPVHLLYLTTWVDADGTVQFRRDVYGRDAKVAAALARVPAVLPRFEEPQDRMASSLPHSRSAS